MKYLSLWILFLVISSSNSPTSFAANADQNTILEFQKQFPIDTVITSGQIVVRDAVVPLPEGTWTVVSSGGLVMDPGVRGGILLNTPNSADGILMLANIKDGKLLGLVYILKRIYPLPASALDFDIGKTCTPSGVFYSQVISKYTHTQDCWFISHALIHPRKDMPPFLTDFYSYMQERNVKVSGSFFIAAEFLKIYKQNYLKIAYYWDPIAENIPRPSKATWADTEWNAVRVNQSPEKLAYLNKIKQIATELHPRISTLKTIYP